jgi:branched-chain amino acid transport system ATP-binding protein
VASDAQPLLSFSGVSAYYGTARALEDVSFEIAGGSTSIIGRNGMGKTTLCNAILGIPPARVTGSMRYKGVELVGRPSYRIAKLGIGYVPQGRRLFPSLSVDEHLRMLAQRGGGKRWTVGRIYELFPRLQERRRNGGAQLSGGEQQMLAIGRCLMGAPELVMFDEPSLGLAPTIVQDVLQAIRHLNAEGLTCVLIEQNVAVSLRLASRAYVLENGRITLSGSGAELLADDRVRQAYLGM